MCFSCIAALRILLRRNVCVMFCLVSMFIKLSGFVEPITRVRSPCSIFITTFLAFPSRNRRLSFHLFHFPRTNAACLSFLGFSLHFGHLCIDWFRDFRYFLPFLFSSHSLVASCMISRRAFLVPIDDFCQGRLFLFLLDMVVFSSRFFCIALISRVSFCCFPSFHILPVYVLFFVQVVCWVWLLGRFVGLVFSGYLVGVVLGRFTVYIVHLIGFRRENLPR